jgi:hypothetical protein
MGRRYPLAVIATIVAIMLFPLSAFAQQQLDQMSPGSDVIGHGKWTVTITAGPSGAPNGFSVWWMKQSTWDDVGQWFPTGNSVQGQVYFTGVPTLNTWGGTLSSFQLAPNQVVKIEIGDVFDETGVEQVNAMGLVELDAATQYVFCAWAIGDGAVTASAYSVNVAGATSTQGEDCQFTMGYWKNHEDDWAVNSLVLGTVNYTKAELLSILNQPANGNGLVILGHQLIAALLNEAAGADLSPIAAEIATAHALIGSLVIPPVGGDSLPSNVVSDTSQVIDDFNNGIIETTCGATPTEASSWGRVKALYR